MEPELSPIPSLVSCIQLLEETKTKTDNEDRDVTAEYIIEIVEVELKLQSQLANHRAEIDKLRASLNRCMLDNEALLAEKSTLVDEIAQYRQSGLDGSDRSGLEGSSYSASSLRSSILSMGWRKGERKNGSIEMLLETNSQLLLQNSQLQVENNALRKSLQANILGGRQKSGHRASFVTDKTANETLSVSSPMPDHWPALNDPYLDDEGSDEMLSHASTGAWVGGHDERQNRIYDDEDDTKWPACGRHTDDENESHDSNSKKSCAEKQDCNDININIFSGIGISWAFAFGRNPSLIEKRRRFPKGKRYSV